MEQQKQEKPLIPYEDAEVGIRVVAQEVNHWREAFEHLHHQYPDSSCYRDMEERYWGYAAALNAALAVIQKQQEPARLMTATDFENNKEMDADGFLPCWIEYGPKMQAWMKEHMDGEALNDGWAAINLKMLVCDMEKNGTRFWTKRPTKEQMEAEPWR